MYCETPFNGELFFDELWSIMRVQYSKIIEPSMHTASTAGMTTTTLVIM